MSFFCGAHGLLRSAAQFRFRTAVGCTVLFALSSAATVADLLSETDRVGADFKSFYYACRAAAQHANFYDVGLLNHLAEHDSAGGVFPFLYPPVFPYLFQRLAELGLARAQFIWSLASIAALSVTLALTVFGVRHRQRLMGIRPIAWHASAALGLGLMMALNLHNVIAMGQINLLVLLLVVPSFVLAESPNQLKSAMLALGILIKVTPVLLLLVFVAQRRFGVLRQVARWAGLWIAATLLLGALPAWYEFARFVPRMGYGRTVPGLFAADNAYNLSIAGFFSRMTQSATVTGCLTCMTMALLGAPLFYIASIQRGVENSGVMVSVYVLIIIGAPLAYVHHVIMLLPVLLWASADGLLLGTTNAGAIVTLGVLAGTDFPMLYGRLHLPHALTVGLSSLNLYALLGLYLLGLAKAWQGRSIVPTRR